MATSGPHRRVVSFALVVVAALLARLAGAQPWEYCGTSGNYTSNSDYQSNIKLLSATLPRNASSSLDLFAKARVGAFPDVVFALTLCRGDTNASACESCVTTAFLDAQQLCAFNKDAFLYYDLCYLSYSNQNFVSSPVMDDSGTYHVLQNSEQIIVPVPVFDAAVATLLNATAAYAAGNSTKRFATGEQAYDHGSYATIYGLTQCTPDLSPDDCRRCLGNLLSWMPQYFSGSQGGRIIGVWCNFRYEVYPFFSGSPSLRLPAPAPAPVNETPAETPPGRSRNKTRIVLAIALPIVAAVLAVNLACFCLLQRIRRPTRDHPDSGNPEDTESVDSLCLDISTLRAATDNFAESNKLGEGEFGTVYKGILLDGKEITVKRLSQSSWQGIKELKNELALISRLHHKNLIKLIGVCMQEHEKLLVYEYMPNRSLDTIIYDPEKILQLDWEKRSKIINGIARGLQYLHEDSQLKIVHRDLKANNVLLDSDYTPKICDFGLARLLGGDQSQEVTKYVVGTYGYMAPEYVMHGHYSIKSDVFSFGILVLEILTRKRSGSFNMEQSVDMISLVWEHWTTGTIVEVIDSSLRGNTPVEQVLKYIHIGLLCVQDNPVDRPTMTTVNVMLSSSSVSLPAPLKPICSESQPRAIDLPGALSPNDLSITEQEPR